MLHHRCGLALFALGVWCLGVVQADPSLLPKSLARQYEAIVPSTNELKWRKVPWLTNLTEGINLAKKEKRPLFLWVAGDDPLERC